MKRKNWTHSEKFNIVLEGLQGHRSVAEICNDYGIHQSQYYKWRETFLREGSKVFQSNDATKKEEQVKKKMEKMERVIGKLTLELKKND